MLDFSPLIYTPKILTAISECLACLVYILILKSKLPRRKLFGYSFAALVLLIVYHLIMEQMPLFFWIPGMAGAFFLMVCIIHFAIDASWKDTLFCGTRAFLFAEFNASFHWHFYVWVAVRLGTVQNFWWYCSAIPVYPLVVFLYYRIERKNISDALPLNVNNRDLCFSLLTVAIIFTVSNLSFATLNTPFSIAEGSILYVRMLLDLGGLVLLYEQQNKRKEMRMELENQAVNAILQKQYEQYRVLVNNGEQLHRELHDLKHYMIALRSENDPEKKLQYLTEMEEAIQIQETFSNTGNHVLDTILTAKSSYCLQHNIQFTHLANGSLLDGIYVKDICSIVGNALDNAIECVVQYAEKEKRHVHFSVAQKNHFVVITCENYCEEHDENAPDTLPRTTKADKKNHGYGLKCIQASAQKYNGSMTIQRRDHHFSLQVIIPIKR